MLLNDVVVEHWSWSKWRIPAEVLSIIWLSSLISVTFSHSLISQLHSLHGTHSFDNLLCTLSFMGKYCFEMFLLKSCLYWIFYFILLKTLNSIWLKSQYGIEWLMVKKVAALKLKGNNQTTYYKGIYEMRMFYDEMGKNHYRNFYLYPNT